MFEAVPEVDFRSRHRLERWTALGAKGAAGLLLVAAVGFVFWLPSCGLALALAGAAWGWVARTAGA